MELQFFTHMLVGKTGQVQKAEHLLFVVVCFSFSAPHAPAFLCTSSAQLQDRAQEEPCSFP